MTSDQSTVAEMVDEILARFSTLEPRRKYMFIEWLRAHSDSEKNIVNVSQGLTTWLESIPQEKTQWEYSLILDEIGWWVKLDERSLAKIMLADLARDGT